MGAFTGKGKQRCRAHRLDLQSLDVIPCTCTKYVQRTDGFSEAKFAEPDPDINGPIPRLRPPGEPPEPA
ncbi:MAG: hypothetical protein ABSC36_03970 [Gaiellaceae bacterium]